MERTIKPAALKPVFAGKHLIDVRRAADRDASPEQLPGAAWHDPEKLAEWAGSLPKDKEIVLYSATSPAPCRCSRSTCTSTATTWTSAPGPAPTSTPS